MPQCIDSVVRRAYRRRSTDGGAAGFSELERLEDTAVVIGDGPDELIMEAAEVCPSIAITVVDSETGAQVYP